MGVQREKLRLLITTSTLPVSPGDGQARFVLDLADALSAHADVTVLAPHAPGAITEESIGSVLIRRFRYFAPSSIQRLAYGAGMRHNIERSWLARIQIPFFLVAQVFATGRIAQTSHASVINAHWLVPQGLTAALVSRFLTIPLVLHVHAADVYFLRNRWLGRRIARYVVRRSASIFVDGSHVRDSLDALVGFSSGATLRPMGVHTGGSAVGTPDGRLPFDLPEKFVAFVGRFVEKKGLKFLIQAIAEVRLAYPDIHLVVVGSGPLESELKTLTGDLELQDFVHFVGARPHADAMAVMRKAEVVCVPSIVDSQGETEGMPTVVLEALAAGARVVGSNVDGIPDILKDAENGWLVMPADSDALARGIETALTDPGDKIAAAGSATAVEHDWRQVAVQYGAVLTEAIRG